eukprot:6209717-Pleurochrysis_carterae.AAC.2
MSGGDGRWRRRCTLRNLSSTSRAPRKLDSVAAYTSPCFKEGGLFWRGVQLHERRLPMSKHSCAGVRAPT